MLLFFKLKNYWLVVLFVLLFCLVIVMVFFILDSLGLFFIVLFVLIVLKLELNLNFLFCKIKFLIEWWMILLL